MASTPRCTDPSAGCRANRQDGAVAVIVAIVLMVLVGMAAFAVDLGIAYNTRQDLQTATDAAALAAAMEFWDNPCPVTAADVTAAESAVQPMNSAAVPEAMWSPLQVSCVDPGREGQVVVTWSARVSLEAIFLGVVPNADPLQPLATASAVVGFEEDGSDLRPFALCSAELPEFGSAGLIGVTGTGADGGCVGLDPAGIWRTTACPVGEAPAGDYLTALAEGCPSPAVPVATSEQGPAELGAALLSACPPSGPDCLGGSDGPAFEGQRADEWDLLVGQRILLPVVCGPPDCDSVATAGVGNNMQYPVYRLADVTICGYSGRLTPDSESLGPPAGCAGGPEGDAGSDWLVIHLHGLHGPDDPPPAVGIPTVSLVAGGQEG